MERQQLLRLGALTGALVCLAGQALAAPLGDARSAARGGVGIALGDLRSTTLNPAAVATAPDAHFAFNLGAGAFAADPDEAIDDIDTTQDDIDALRSLIDSGSYSPGDEQVLVRDLQTLDGKKLQLEAGANLLLALPMDSLKMVFFSRANLRAAGSVYYDTGDQALLQQPTPDVDNLQTTVNVSGVGVADAGLAFAYTNTSPLGRLDWGTAVKYQRILLAGKAMRIADYDEADIFDRDRDTQEASKINLDVGVTQHLGDSHWLLAAVLENLVPYEVKLDTTGHTFKSAPQLTVGAAYDLGWLRTEANVELAQNNGFAEVQSTQFARFGFEIGHAKSVQFRLGAIHDLKNNQEDLFTVGLGLSPFDVVNLDIAAMAGSERNVGAMLGIGLKI